MVTVEELRETWAEMARHKNIALLALDSGDDALAEEHLNAACQLVKGVVERLG